MSHYRERKKKKKPKIGIFQQIYPEKLCAMDIIHILSPFLEELGKRGRTQLNHLLFT